MIQFKEDFFRGEEREGFYVPQLMKRAWAAELEVLVLFDEICTEYGIRYYLGCGTLLGAVRHRGFIPWDDDIDVWMLRGDAMKLNELPKSVFSGRGLELINSWQDPQNTNLGWRVDNGRTLMLTEEHLLRYHLCPFHLGVDIFPLDFVPGCPEDARLQDILLGCANTLGREWDNPKISEAEKRETYIQLQDALNITLPENMPYRQRLMILSDLIMSMYGKEDGEFIASIPEKKPDGGRIFRPEWFGKPIYLEFEGLQFPAPCAPEKVLAAEFGDDYMTPARIYESHSYPFYKNQHAKLLELLSDNHMECPEFFL